MRRGLILGVLLAVLVLVGWWLLLMAPKSSDIADFDEQREIAAGEATALTAQRNQLEELAAKQGDFELALAQLRLAIPDRPDGAALIEDITQIGVEADVDLISLSPALPGPSSIPGLVEITTEMTIEGSYFRVLSFLLALEQLERIVRVDAIAIASTEAADGTNLLSVTLTASAFSRSDLTGTPAEALGQ